MPSVSENTAMFVVFCNSRLHVFIEEIDTSVELPEKSDFSNVAQSLAPNVHKGRPTVYFISNIKVKKVSKIASYKSRDVVPGGKTY